MKLKLPRAAAVLWEAFVEWGDVPVYTFGRHALRRIDILIALAGLGCTAYYGWIGGWRGALVGALAFTFVAMIALWFL